MFIVQVAGDIFGNKVNYELSFPSRPTIAELTKQIEAVFSTEIANTRPEGVPAHTFHTAKIKIYDEDKNKWVDLLGESQLMDYCQAYAFQPENAWHKESQKAIPPATKPPTPLPSSPQRYGALSNSSPTTAALGSLSGARGSAATSSALAPYTGGRGGADVRSEPSTSSRRPYAAASAAANPSTALVPNIAVDASTEEKIRVVFSEFDVKGTRMIDLDDFKQGFHAMALDFSSATVEDLFERADLNRDNRISFSEFERFARLYHIMTDCLYFRSKAFWDEEQLLKEIQSERDAVVKAELALDQAQRVLEAAEGDVTTAQLAVREADEELRARTDRMRDLAKDLDDARREKERVLRVRKDRERDLIEVKEKEKEARKGLQDIARDSDKLERRAAALSTDAAAADEKVRQLQKALEEAMRAADRAHQAAEQAESDAEQAKERERDAALEADLITRDISKADEAVRLAERTVASTDQALKELDNLGKEIGREADAAARRRDAGERLVAETKDKVTLRMRELSAAREAVEERERNAKQKEAELDEHRHQRALVTQHERTLIEQELRLREQRDSLELRETKLMSEATNFLGNMRTHLSTGRSYSRDPSAF